MEELKSFVKVERRSLFYVLGGALGALGFLVLGRVLERGKPQFVGMAKEIVSFSEWLAGKFDEIKENFEDIVAEGKFAHVSEKSDLAEILEREEKLIKTLESLLKEKEERGPAKEVKTKRRSSKEAGSTSKNEGEV